MLPKELEGDTLGDKHRNYNKVLRELSIKQHTAQDITKDESDVNNLFNIDIACQNRDVEYILKILKCDDMLYVSRALARCVWLVTDPKYANIIDPEYLQSEMFPNMSTKAIHKLKKHVRHNIKDEIRAEKFYQHENNKLDASKWLPYCSVKFIEDNINNHVLQNEPTMKLRLLKRISEKSITIFETVINNLQFYERGKYLQMVTFFLKTDVDKYLDFLEKDTYRYGNPKLNHKATDLIMKHSPKRVIDKIETYISVIDIPTFVKYIQRDNIKPFLLSQMKKDLDRSQLRKLFHYDNLKHFIMKLPKEEQFKFVENLCIGKNIERKELPDENSAPVDDAVQMYKICNECNKQGYIWYLFAPFNYAFEEITNKLIQGAKAHEKHEMLSLLIKCAQNDLQHIQIILKYYQNKHKNDEQCAKLQFVTELLKQTNIAKYNNNTWETLNELLTSMKIYEKSELSTDHKEIVNSIILYNALNDGKCPEIIEKLFLFDTLKAHTKQLNEHQKNKVYEWLYEHLLHKMQNPITTEKQFAELVNIVESMLKLMVDYDKSLLDYPGILDKIRQLIQLKKKNSWKEQLITLYNVKKSWRKHMFEESVYLSPTEEVCLNALKHEPQLLVRYNDDVNIIKTNEKISLSRLLSKLRIYWPNTLAQQWAEEFLHKIREENTQKAVVRNLCVILPQKHLLDIADKYKPVKPKIDWKETDEHVLNLQRLLAKNMHLGRPQPTPEAILSYAKGDYLQYALPSLLSIFYNLSLPMNRKYIPKLLDAPISLQKHGIRFAFKKLNQGELKQISLDCWKSSKNVSIRATIFKHTFALLCNEKQTENINSIWELLELFIDNLTFTENKDIYELLCQIEKVPLNIRAKYLVKSYNFIRKLIPNLIESERSNYKWRSVSMVGQSRELMDTICPKFIKEIMEDFIHADFLNSEGKYVDSIHHSDSLTRAFAAYLLYATNESDQLKRYEEIFMPLMSGSFEKWNDWDGNNYYIRQRFQQLLTRLSYDLVDYVDDKKVVTPIKMYSFIKHELEKKIPIAENYLMLTKWKLTVELMKLRKEYSSGDCDKTVGHEFGSICLELLKEDTKLHFPCVYVLFSKAVKEVMDYLMPKPATLEFYQGMLTDKDFIQSYLSSIEIGSDHSSDANYTPIWEKIYWHPSVEVKMHYFSKIGSEPPAFKLVKQTV